MKALVYHGPGKIALEERPKPKLQAIGDAIVKITKCRLASWRETPRLFSPLGILA
jgi:threonine dehydrogenase-like Zn-dependent dehydrogenase